LRLSRESILNEIHNLHILMNVLFQYFQLYSTLDPNVICKACTYKDSKTGSFKKPSWKDHPEPKDETSSYKYYPSANAAPTRFTPVLYKPSSGKKTERVEDEIFCQPMMFGMIPAYHKVDNYYDTYTSSPAGIYF
jgi:hypothetical protein